MGFYLRRAFGFGPLRLNLSKSGVGFSVGVKGARIGVSPRGQAYVHAGRAGFQVSNAVPHHCHSPHDRRPRRCLTTSR